MNTGLFNDTGISEVDFVVQLASSVIPIEVKTEENLKAKSLRSFSEKYKPNISIKASMSNFRAEKILTNLPLYVISI